MTLTATRARQPATAGAATPRVAGQLGWVLVGVGITVLVATIQLILQLKIFDQVYLFAQGGRTDSLLSMVWLIYRSAFQKNQGGYAAAAAVVLFALIVIVSVLQYQAARIRGQK